MTSPFPEIELMAPADYGQVRRAISTGRRRLLGRPGNEGDADHETPRTGVPIRCTPPSSWGCSGGVPGIPDSRSRARNRAAPRTRNRGEHDACRFPSLQRASRTRAARRRLTPLQTPLGRVCLAVFAHWKRRSAPGVGGRPQASSAGVARPFRAKRATGYRERGSLQKSGGSTQ